MVSQQRRHLIFGEMGIFVLLNRSPCPGTGPCVTGRGAGAGGGSGAAGRRWRARLCLAGGELQEPPREPRGVPGQHEAAADDRGVALEHAADRSVGPGACRDPPRPRRDRRAAPARPG